MSAMGLGVDASTVKPFQASIVVRWGPEVAPLAISSCPFRTEEDLLLNDSAFSALEP